MHYFWKTVRVVPVCFLALPRYSLPPSLIRIPSNRVLKLYVTASGFVPHTFQRFVSSALRTTLTIDQHLRSRN